MTDTFIIVLLVASLTVPLAFLCACLVKRWRRHALALQWLAPMPALAAGAIGFNRAPISYDLAFPGCTLRLDPSGALLLAVCALLWIVVSAALWRDREPDGRFGVSWLLTMIGNIGVFIAGDLVSFYLVYALVSIPAYGLFAFSDDPERKHAGAVYMAFAILGEALLLLAFAMLVAGEPNGSARIADAVSALPTSPWQGATLALIIAGFGMKIGLIPFNGWMPLTYGASPIPAAAVLSGAAVKAGVIGLIRFLPLGVPLESWGGALMAAGFFSAFYGAVIGLTQRNPKVILAYSSISQMGVISAALGMALLGGHADASLNVAFYAANHVLIKSALFLAIAVVAGKRFNDAWFVLAAILALSLAGLPLTGGALAKLALKAEFGAGLAATLSVLSSIGTALLMTHFLIRLSTPLPGAAAECGRSLIKLWPVFAVGALFLPWTYYPAIDDVSNALEFRKLLDGLWPVALGAGIALLLRRLDWSLPEVPPGDSIVLGESAFCRVVETGRSFEMLDARLRQWQAAGVSILLIVLALLAAGLSSS